jgi:hypothetical protein
MMHETSGLNIVPVDYAAKAIVRASKTEIKELNIVSRRSVPNMYTVPEMLRQVGYTNFQFQETMPDDLNAVEKLYYRTVGAQLSNYLSTPETPDTQFNTEVLNELMHDIETPKIEQHFSALCNYAVEREFANILA